MKQVRHIIPTPICTFAGIKGSSAFEGIGFLRSASQPKDDPRHYFFTALVSSLIGNEPAVHEIVKKCFNFNKKVNGLIQ